MSDSVAPGTVAISAITGDAGRLSYVPEENCAGIAGKATLDLLGVRSVGVSLTLHKGLPLGSGLGSSAASAAAAAVAVNFDQLPPRARNSVCLNSVSLCFGFELFLSI